MTDDIVTRLRDSSGMTTCRSDDGFMSIVPDTMLMREAADEIELLRSALLGLACDFVVEAYLDKSAEAVVDDYYKRAVRGE